LYQPHPNVRARLAQTDAGSAGAITIGSETIGFAQHWLAWHDRQRAEREANFRQWQIFWSRWTALAATATALVVAIRLDRDGMAEVVSVDPGTVRMGQANAVQWAAKNRCHTRTYQLFLLSAAYRASRHFTHLAARAVYMFSLAGSSIAILILISGATTKVKSASSFLSNTPPLSNNRPAWSVQTS
jgi:hypothetical protein